MDIVNLWTLQVMMFLMMAAGVVLKKTGVLGPESRNMITDLVLCFTMPCNIINSFRMEFDMSILVKFGIVIGISVLMQVISYVLSRILYNNREDGIKRVLRYCTIVSNSGFLGLPITEQILGAEGVMYASVFIIPMRIMMWTAGISCFANMPDLKSVVKKLATHPCIVALYIGIPLLILGPYLNSGYQLILSKAPGPLAVLAGILVPAIGKMISGAGGTTTALTMILIGNMLADIKPSDFLDGNVFFITCVRQGLIPLAALIICTILGVSPFLTAVSVLMASMPVGSSTAMLAAKYECDHIFATKCVVVSTLLSLITVPIWCMITSQIHALPQIQ